MGALHSLAEHYDFVGKREDFIRERLVIGMRDKEVSKILQMEQNLMLEDAISKA